MSKRKTPADPEENAAGETAESFAALVIEKLGEQVHVLFGRMWPDICRILDKEGEIAIGMKALIADRKATPGEQADKDNRIKLTISFSEKYSDSIESDLPDPDQGELGLK